MYADHQILILSLSLTQPASVYVSLYLVAESTIPPSLPVLWYLLPPAAPQHQWLRHFV